MCYGTIEVIAIIIIIILTPSVVKIQRVKSSKKLKSKAGVAGHLNRPGTHGQRNRTELKRYYYYYYYYNTCFTWWVGIRFTDIVNHLSPPLVIFAWHTLHQCCCNPNGPIETCVLWATMTVCSFIQVLLPCRSRWKWLIINGLRSASLHATRYDCVWLPVYQSRYSL